jgi:predicted transcriptional regulator
MSVTEILDELPKLKPEERQLLFQRLSELEEEAIEETPEMLAAIDEGLHSMRTGKNYTVEQVRELVAQWTSKSP